MNVVLCSLLTSVAAGVVLGTAMALAPNVAADTAITDPIHLGLMWFVRPHWPLTLVAPLLHLLAGVLLGIGTRLVPSMGPRVAALVAVAINGAATLVENLYGMGVMGAGGWLLGSGVSAALMLAGGALARRVRA